MYDRIDRIGFDGDFELKIYWKSEEDNCLPLFFHRFFFSF